MIDSHHGWNFNVKPLIIGFLLSLVLTLAAYYTVVFHAVSGKALQCLIMGLGGVQALIQLVLFLHLGMESKPRWTVTSFLFMVLVILIVVGGSLWIMYHLNYTMMPTMDMSSPMSYEE